MIRITERLHSFGRPVMAETLQHNPLNQHSKTKSIKVKYLDRLQSPGIDTYISPKLIKGVSQA